MRLNLSAHACTGPYEVRIGFHGKNASAKCAESNGTVFRTLFSCSSSAAVVVGSYITKQLFQYLDIYMPQTAD